MGFNVRKHDKRTKGEKQHEYMNNYDTAKNVIFRSAQVTPTTIVHVAATISSAYYLINKKSCSNCLRSLESVRGIPPAPNWFKLNFDDSVTSNSSAVGFIIRDSCSPIVSGAQKLHNSSVSLAECFALRADVVMV
ncbi:hypothetical protein ACLB2K_059478 [Fragaria x ananassa]